MHFSTANKEGKTIFLSTPSARRATDCGNALSGLFRISIHALREEGDLDSWHYAQDYEISIHALREEGDFIQIYRNEVPRVISIHALREEGDSKNRDKISIFKQIIQHSARI